MTGDTDFDLAKFDSALEEVRHMIGRAGLEIAELAHDGAMPDIQGDRDPVAQWLFMGRYVAPAVAGITDALLHLAQRIDRLEGRVE